MSNKSFVLIIIIPISFIPSILKMSFPKKKKNGFKVLSVYSFVTTVVFMCYISHEIVDKINITFITNLYRSIGGIYNFMLLLFPLLGVAIVTEFVVYFIRYYKINRKK